MRAPQTTKGYLFEAHGAFHLRYNVREGGKSKQRSYKLCLKDDAHSSKDSPAVIALAEEFIVKINQANSENDAQPGHRCPLCKGRCKKTITGRFAPKA